MKIAIRNNTSNNNDYQISSSSAERIEMNQSQRKFTLSLPGDSSDDECATDEESEVAAVNKSKEFADNTMQKIGENKCTTTVSSSEGASSNYRKTDDARPQKKLSPFRQPRRFCFSSSSIDQSNRNKQNHKLSISLAELGSQKATSPNTFDRATFVHKSPYGIYNVQLKKKAEPSPRQKTLESAGHGFNKSTFNYTSPYSEHNLMTSSASGVGSGVGSGSGSESGGGSGGGSEAGCRASVAPVFYKRLCIGDNQLLQRRSSESTREDFSLDDFEDYDFEVLKDDDNDYDDNDDYYDDNDDNDDYYDDYDGNSNLIEQYNVYNGTTELYDIESMRNISRSNLRCTSPGSRTCSTYMSVPGLQTQDLLCASDSLDLSGRDKAEEEEDDDKCFQNEYEIAFAQSPTRKVFEAVDGETIAAMDPESFAEYLGSQSLLDMMANAHAVRDEDGGGGVDWDGSRSRDREREKDGCRGRDGGWNRDRSADKDSTAYFLST